MKVSAEPQETEKAFQYDSHQKRHTVSKEQWQQLQKDELIPPINSKFYPEYGVLFNNHGYLLPGLKKVFLFVMVDISKKRHIKEMNFDLPDCDEWAE